MKKYPEPSYTIGIEEEYMLVDVVTRNLHVDPDPGLMEACQRDLGDQVKPEFLRPQMEVGTKVCTDIKDARRQLSALRKCVIDHAKKYELAPIAASTHPFAEWNDQLVTDHERYLMILRLLRAQATRLLANSMHVHVGIEDKNLRIELMNQVRCMLPFVMALTTSSPFWRGIDTGLQSFRLGIWGAFPRTGMPGHFESWDQFEDYVATLQEAGVVKDGTEIWWDIRPHVKFPTLEMRLCDICPDIDDSMAVAALYICFIRMLYHMPSAKREKLDLSQMLISENRWRGQRYGIDGKYISFGERKQVEYRKRIVELLDELQEHAQALNCVEELNHVHTILKRGTSAHIQRDIYKKARENGADNQKAMIKMVDYLIETTASGLDAAEEKSVKVASA